jgi:hypothetical protein
MDADPLPAVATRPVGAPDTDKGVTLTAADSVPGPAAFTARSFIV